MAAGLDTAAISADALRLTRRLATEIGPRRPTSPAERRAAEAIAGELGEAGVEAAIEPFEGYSSFAWPFGVVLAAASSGSPALSAAGAVAGALEGGFVRTPLSDLLSRRASQNLVGSIEPGGETQRTLCLVCHLDSSRSGLMFHPEVVRHLSSWIRAQNLAVGIRGLEIVLRRSRVGRALSGVARGIALAGLLLLAERELRGEDVPGANDNASGAGVVAALVRALAAAPLRHTRVAFLMTGCEESGLTGAQRFLRSRDTTGWLFLNLDGIGGPATLRYLPREGLVRTWPADPALLGIAAAVGRSPEIELAEQPRNAGLTYDATPVLARGGRGLTLTAQDDVIPNYHWPSDTFENLDERSVRNAVEATAAILAAVERGEAD